MDLLIVPYKLGKKQGYRTTLNGVPFSRKPVELERAVQQAEALKMEGGLEKAIKITLEEAIENNTLGTSG